MLDAEQIRATIAQRLLVADESCNSAHIASIGCQLRALVYVLGDGTPPPGFNGSSKSVCDAAGIPYQVTADGEIELQDAWLKEHGFEVDEDDARHPTLGVGW